MALDTGAVLIRAASTADARAIAAIHVRAWRAAYPGIVPADYLASLSIDRYETIWRERISAGTPQLLVAVGADGAKGWVAFGPSRDEGAGPEVAEIWAIYVDAVEWGSGIGRCLWEAAKARLREQGYTSVGLWAFAQNARAARFYRALGFEVEPGSGKTFELDGAQIRELRYVRALEAERPGSG